MTPAGDEAGRAAQLPPDVMVGLAERLRDFYGSLPEAEQHAFAAFCQGGRAAEDVAGFEFTPGIFDPGRHFVGVLLQQGRVQLDADAGEPSLISRRLRRWPPG
jgi:hypothetical protein